MWYHKYDGMFLSSPLNPCLVSRVPSEHRFSELGSRLIPAWSLRVGLTHNPLYEYDFVGPGWLGDWVLSVRETSKPYPAPGLKILGISSSPPMQHFYSNYTTSAGGKHFEHVVTNSNNVITVNTGTSDEDNQIREWLSPLRPQQRHQDVRANRLDGVGSWLLEASKFWKWSNGEDGFLERVLFFSGGPGVGKTYLSSLVIDGLCDRAEEK
ncbi:hypothetical protein HOY80DRAFT_1022673, partial [Tuber brumale]